MHYVNTSVSDLNSIFHTIWKMGTRKFSCSFLVTIFWFVCVCFHIHVGQGSINMSSYCFREQ